MHYQICEAPICIGDQNPNYKKEVIWYPGEAVCVKPSQITKIQRRINKKVANNIFKYPYRFFTGEMLERLSCVMNGTKGLDPERDKDSQMVVFDKKHVFGGRSLPLSNLKGSLGSPFKKGVK